ncbi:MAG: LysE family transporter [Spirosomataceae bacterium]
MVEFYKPVLIFVVTAVISFVGSIQLGPVNLTVIQSVLRRNLQAGLWVAVGGSLPEMLYAGVAIWAGMWLKTHQTVWLILEWSAVPVLLGIGLVTFFTPGSSMTLSKINNPSSASMAKGFLVGMLNPQLFPYWLVMLLQFSNYDLLRVQTITEQMAFVAGTAVGALFLLIGVAILSFRFRERLMEQISRWSINRFLGVLFVLLAVGQFLKIWIKS